MLRAVSLAVFLAILWLLLSGYFTEPLLLGLGAASVLFVAVVSYRKGVVDAEGHPVHLLLRALLYWPWLLWEIVKSNLQVARIILSPRLEIAPELIKVPTGQESDLGRVIYANSITLTPGTVSIYVWSQGIEVHALNRDFAADLEGGEMDRRVCGMEGQS